MSSKKKPDLYNDLHPEKSLKNTERTNDNDEFATTLGLNYSFMKKFTLTVNGNYWTKFNTPVGKLSAILKDSLASQENVIIEESTLFCSISIPM